MKKLLITPRIDAVPDYGEQREGIDARWGQFVTACGFLLCPVSYAIPFSEYVENIPDIAGVILSGGNNLASVESSAANQIRDDYEAALVALAAEKGLPIIGVCRGMQLLASLSGAKIRPCEGHVGRHGLIGAPGIAYDFPGEVNSFHNYCVDLSQSSLQALAHAEDDVLEAFEDQSRPHLGIMWHPERDKIFSEKNIRLFQNHFGGERDAS